MAAYHFVTRWRLRAPVEDVWRAIIQSEDWPRWWKGVVSVTRLREGDSAGIGEVRRFVWKSRLPYTLAFDMEVRRIEAPSLLEGRASGELEGTGLWELSQHGEWTDVVYTWDVRTTRPWMNLLAPIARPLFAWNHNYVMDAGGKGLARLLGTELIATGHGSQQSTPVGHQEGDDD